MARGSPDDHRRSRTAEVSRSVIALGDRQIEVLSQGPGPLIVLLPSLGCGAEDFDAIAERVAAAGFRGVQPQPRGVGGSRGPLTGIDLHDYADDVASVIDHAADGPSAGRTLRGDSHLVRRARASRPRRARASHR